MKFINIPSISECSSGRAERRYTPFSDRIDVTVSTLERLLALYRAGYLPDSAGLYDISSALGWEDCAELDNAIALNIFIEIRLPDGYSIPGYEITRQVDFGKPRTAVKDDLVILAQRTVFDWWGG